MAQTETKGEGQFTFTIETTKELPKKAAGGGGKVKYDWSVIPAPAKGEFNKVTIPDGNYKTIYNSLKKYTKKCETAGTKPVPKFDVFRLKGEDGKAAKKGVEVYRSA